MSKKNMADTISMPSGMGGLTRYFDEFQSRLQIKPAYVVLMILAFIAFEIAIRSF